MEEDRHLFSINKEKYLSNETENLELEKLNKVLRGERDDLSRENLDVKD